MDRKIGSLDGLRGIAILMVLSCHLVYVGAVPNHPAFMFILKGIMWTGWSGVDLFFALSGFLITGILLDSRSSANYFKSFYCRRALRIFPLYYFAVFASIILIPLLARFGHHWLLDLYPTKLGWLSYALYYQNWWITIKEPGRGILGHFWSLGVEEQFYLLWPACVWLVEPKRLKWVCLITAFSVLILRCAMAHPGQSSQLILMSTITRIDTLLIGAFVAISIRDQALAAKVRYMSPVVFLLSVLAIAWIAFVKDEARSRAYYTQTLGFTAYACAYACIVLWAVTQNGTGSWLDRALNFKPLRMCGKYSYGIYVYHALIFLFAARKLSAYAWFGKDLLPSALACLVLALASLAVAMLSFRFLEKPFLDLKIRFSPSTPITPKPGKEMSLTRM